MKCGYCFLSKKQLSRFEARNGERVSICKSCCKKHFGCTFKQLEKFSRTAMKSVNMELVAFIIVKATLWANELFKDAKKAEQWLTSINPQFQGDSPLEVILRGDGSHVIRFLEERLSRRSGSAF